MMLACLKCEGCGVVRDYLNRAGDYNKYHCPLCGGTGKVDYDEPYIQETVAKLAWANYEKRQAEAKAKRAEIVRKLKARWFSRGR